MGKPVNFNRFRKDKARAEKTTRADRNSLKFGRTKPQKELEKSKAAKAKRDLDGHQRDP
ncbi:MAG: DUF4169 family protein [Rhodobacterales bacterium]|nr:DUF4169 family protein [Rhodobacterales bacterium]